MITTADIATRRSYAPLRELAARARQQACVADFGAQALRETDLEKLMRDACGVVGETLDSEFTSLLELVPERSELAFRSTRGPWRYDVTTAPIANDPHTLSGFTLTVDEPVIIDDIRRETRLTAPRFVHDHGIVSLISVIVRGSVAPFGVLVTGSPKPHYFSSNAVVFMRAIANVLAAAIDRIRAEEALRNNVAKLELLIDNLPVAITILDHDGNTLRVNRMVSEMLGLSPTAIGRGEHVKLPTLRPDGTPRPHEELASHRVLDGEPFAKNVETGIVRRDGSVVWTSVSAVPTSIADWRTLLVSTDITERKRAEEALKKSEERFRSYFDLGMIGIAITSAGKRMIECNDEFCRILGYEREELMRMSWDQFTHAADLDADLRQYEALATGRIERYSMEKRFIRKDGHVIDAEISVRAIRRDDGTVDSVLGLLKDITGRKRTEAELARSERRLRALSRRLIQTQEKERRQVARELHDEIGQTLTAVKIAIDSLMRRDRSGSRFLDEAEAAGVVVDTALERVRTLSMTLRPAMLDDLGLEPTLHWYFDSVMRHAGIECEYEFRNAHTRLAPEVEITLFRIAQEAVTNIVRHAHAHTVRVTLSTTAKYAELVVSDDGAGFSRGVISRKASTGLSAMRERATLIRGTLSIVSKKGKGTTVRVRVPQHAS